MTRTDASSYVFGTAIGGTHQVILRRIVPGTKVLDVGCHTGYLGKALHERGCLVWGVDSDADALSRVGSGWYVETLCIDLNNLQQPVWPDVQFDYVVAADVLEHVVDPLTTLRVLGRSLACHGRALVSLPNIAHVSVRLSLLLGRFEYQEAGILDKTHLHFYTFKTARELIESAGLRVTAILSGSNRFGVLLNEHLLAGRLLRGLLAYSVIVEATRA